MPVCLAVHHGTPTEGLMPTLSRRALFLMVSSKEKTNHKSSCWQLQAWLANLGFIDHCFFLL